MNHRDQKMLDYYYADPNRALKLPPRYSRWGVVTKHLSDHPILLQCDRASVPKHVLFDKLPDDVIRLHDEGTTRRRANIR